MLARLIACVLCLVLAGSIGLYLLKYEVKSVEQQLANTHHEIRKTKERLTVLKAEWSFLNRPERIEALTRKHLDLGPSHGDTLQALSKVPSRFPDNGTRHGLAVLPEKATKPTQRLPIAPDIQQTPQ